MVGWTGARGLFTRSFITLVVWAYADTAATVAASDRRNLIFIRKKLCTCCTQGRAAPENGPQTLRGYQMLEQSLSVVKLFVLQYHLMKQKRLYGMDGLSCVFISTCMYSKYFPNYIGKYDLFIIRISNNYIGKYDFLLSGYQRNGSRVCGPRIYAGRRAVFPDAPAITTSPGSS